MDDTLAPHGPPAPSTQPASADVGAVGTVATGAADVPLPAQAQRAPGLTGSADAGAALVSLPPALPTWREQLPIASVAIVLGASLVAWSLWQRRRAGAARAAAGPGLARGKKSRSRLSLQESQALQRDVADLTEKVAQQSDVMAQQWEVRTARLEALLAQADQRIAALEKAHAALPAAAMEAKPASPAPRSPLGAAPAPSRHPLDAPATAHRDVYALADSGLTPVQIAQRLGTPTGQVELILNLRRAAV